MSQTAIKKLRVVIKLPMKFTKMVLLRLHPIYTDQVLRIRNASYPRDVGDFKCVASNRLSPDAELIVSLDVQGIYYKLGRNIIPLYFV